jgi:hypothetical protein
VITERPSLSRGWPVHPLLFAVYNVVFLWGINVSLVGWREGLFLCVVAVTIAAIMEVLCTVILRERLAGALLASLVVMITFTYGRVYDVIVGINVGGVLIGRHRFLLLACAVLLVMVGRVLWRSRRSFVTTTAAFTVAALCLLTLAAIPMGRHVAARVASPSAEQSEVQRSLTGSHARPDIYYIIADSYGAASTLDEVYGFSNEPFLQALRERGFYVAEKSRSNYMTTELSLTSSLAMNYIVAPRSRFALKAPVLPDRVGQLRSVAAIRFVQRQGYAILNLKPLNLSEWARLRVVGKILPSLQWNSLSLELVRSSILTELVGKFMPQNVREIFLGTVGALFEARDNPGPKFVFMHLWPPHPPFVFTASGAPRAPSNLENFADRAGYIDQLQFVNKTLLAVIDSLLSGPTGKPIIILQGDHGPASAGGSWRAPSLALIRERLPILNAYRVPRRECPFYPTVTPVNSFRIIFNCVFNARLRLLPDSSFWSPPRLLYEFRNVTALLSSGDSAAHGEHTRAASQATRR